MLNFNQKTSNVTLSYHFIITIFTFIFLSFAGIISYAFYFFQNELTRIKKTVEIANLRTDGLIQQLLDEKNVQAQKIFQLEESLGIHEKLTSVDPVATSQVLKLFGSCCAVIGFVILAYFAFKFVSGPTIVGKILSLTHVVAGKAFDKLTGGFFGTHVTTYEIEFPDQDFVLQILIKSDESCAVMYKFGSYKIFLPFEMFLADHESLLGKTSINKVIKAINELDGSAVLDASHTLAAQLSPEAAKSIEAVSAALLS